MEMQEWKDGIVEKAKRQLAYRNNLSGSDIDSLTIALFDYLDEGINVLREWRKLSNDVEFISGKHDNALIVFLKEKNQANGRDLFGDYSSGGIKANMKTTPENRLKGSCKQVM